MQNAAVTIRWSWYSRYKYLSTVTRQTKRGRIRYVHYTYAFCLLYRTYACETTSCADFRIGPDSETIAIIVSFLRIFVGDDVAIFMGRRSYCTIRRCRDRKKRNGKLDKNTKIA